MGTQGDIVPSDIVKVSQPLQTIQEKTVERTFKKTDYVEIEPEQPFDEKSRLLRFHVRPVVNRCFNPSKWRLVIPVKIVSKANNSNSFAGPGNYSSSANPSTHARFRNPVGANLIQNVEIRPMRSDDIEVMDPKKHSLVEKMRFYLQNSYEERRHPEAMYEEGKFYSLARFKNNFLAGISGDTYTDPYQKRASIDSDELERLTHNKYHTFLLPVDATFTEIDSHFDGMIEFMVEITLAPGHKCILAGKETPQGINPFRTRSDASSVPDYLIDTTNTWLRIQYEEMFKADDEKFREAFYTSKDTQFEAFHSLDFVRTLPFSDKISKPIVIRQQFTEIQGAWPEKFFLFFVRASEFEDDIDLLAQERWSAEPFNITKVDIHHKGRSIFKHKPLDWTNTPDNARYLWSMQADVTGKRYDYQNRHNPFTDLPATLANGKWIAFIHLKEESDSKFTEVTPRLNAEFVLYVYGNAAAATANDLVGVIMWKTMPLHVLGNSVANKWERVTTYATPINTPEGDVVATRTGKY